MNYAVEAARLGQITDYDKLSLEVWTNGSVEPADAIGLAAKLLKDHMNIFINFEEEVEATTSPDDRKPEIKNENLNRSVEELERLRFSFLISGLPSSGLVVASACFKVDEDVHVVLRPPARKAIASAVCTEAVRTSSDSLS